MKNKVVIKSSKTGLSIYLNPECTFEELLEELKKKFQESARFWGNIQMALMLEGRPLTAEEEFRVVNVITENSGIDILCLLDQDVERMERCEKALNQKLMELSSRTGQFYKGDLRRGESLESEASVVVIGDINHGARVTAKGNIVVIGALRGTVHAGVSGNREAVIAALEMAPLQIKIADLSKQFSDKGRKLGRGPMTAFVEDCSICTKSIKKGNFSILNFH